MEHLIKMKTKKTEVGFLPEDWEVKPLEYYFDFISYGFTNPMPTSNNGIYMITARDVNYGQVLFDSARLTPLWAYNEYLTKKSKPVKNDILLTKDGTLGRLALVGNEMICINQSVAIIRPNSKIEPLFLKKLLESTYYQRVMLENAGGSTIKHIYVSIVNKMLIGVPPILEEQKAIATALSDVDELISNLDQLLIKKKAIKQGAMQQLLTPDENWFTKTIKEVATYRRGSFPQPYGLAKWYDDISGMPFVQVVDVGKNKKLKAETKQKISKEGAQMSVFVKKGSVILTIQGSIGRICITQYDAYVDRTLLIFESFKEDFNTYFFMISIWLKFQIEKENAPGGIIKTITKEALSSFEISFPNRLEQDRIAKILEDIDLDLEQLETKKAKYQAIKQGMMQELLTGKTRLV